MSNIEKKRAKENIQFLRYKETTNWEKISQEDFNKLDGEMEKTIKTLGNTVHGMNIVALITVLWAIISFVAFTFSY